MNIRDILADALGCEEIKVCEAAQLVKSMRPPSPEAISNLMRLQARMAALEEVMREVVVSERAARADRQAVLGALRDASLSAMEDLERAKRDGTTAPEKLVEAQLVDGTIDRMIRLVIDADSSGS